jgi:cation transport ATPase
LVLTAVLASIPVALPATFTLAAALGAGLSRIWASFQRGSRPWMKGAFAVVMSLTQPSPDASTTANQLEAQGFRVLAVAVGPPEAVKLAGIIALSDPPRTDSAALITELHRKRQTKTGLTAPANFDG